MVLAPLFLAVERGYLAEQNIEPQLVLVQNASEVVAALLTDQMQLSTGPISAGLLNALSRGIDLRVIAPLGNQPGEGPGVNQVLVRRALWDTGEVSAAADLRGRRVAVAGRGSLNEYILYKILQRHGISLLDVDVTPMPFPDMLTGLAGGSIDGALTAEPFITGAVARGVAVPLPDPADANVVPGSPVTYIMTSRRFVEAQRSVAVRFLRGIAKAARALEDGRGREPENLQVLAKYAGLDPAVLANIVLAEWDASLALDPAFIADQQAFYTATGQLERPVDLGTLVAPEFAAEAVGRG
jgi:NitT/TauT family transport system substrate-binding protein